MNITSTPWVPKHRLNAVALSIALSAATLAGCGPQQPSQPGQPVATSALPGGVTPPQQAAMNAAAPPNVQAMPVQPVPPQPMAPAQTAYAARPQVYPPAGQPVPPAGPVYQDGPPPVVAQAYPPAPPPAALPAPRVARQRIVAQAPAPVASDRIGRVASIEPIHERPQGSGAGGVLGGVLGAVVGNQFGHGTGRAALTVLGGVGGAVAGNNVERNVKERVVGYRISVVLDDGASRSYEESSTEGLRVGDRVRVEGNGLRRI